METVALLFLKQLDKLTEYEREILIQSVRLENNPIFVTGSSPDTIFKVDE